MRSVMVWVVRSLAAMGVGALFVESAAASLPNAYTTTDLGTLGGKPVGKVLLEEATGMAINNEGQIVGKSSAPSSGAAGWDHPFLWTPTTPNGTSGTMVDLGLPASEPNINPFIGEATAINDQGLIGGESADSNTQRAFYWSPSSPNGAAGTFSDAFGTPQMSDKTVVNGVNDSGQLVGVWRGMGSALWTPGSGGGTLVPVGALNGVGASEANGINGEGQVVGIDGNDKPYLWTPTSPNGNTGQTIELPSPPNATFGAARAINSEGAVVGDYFITNQTVAFIWTPSVPNGTTGTMTLLPNLNYGPPDNALGINDFDEVVGTGPGYAPFGDSAFVWTPTDGMVDLNNYFDPALKAEGWVLTSAVGVNDAGQIVANGGLLNDPINGPEYEHTFLLTPMVPEPASVGVLGGLGIWSCVRRPRRRRIIFLVA